MVDRKEFIASLLGIGVLAGKGAAAAAGPMITRLESLTWEPTRRLFSFRMSYGEAGMDDAGNPMYTPIKTLEYQMNFRSSEMSLGAEARPYPPIESALVGEVLGVVARYANASAEWWEKGTNLLNQSGKQDSVYRAGLAGGVLPGRHGRRVE